ncbi:MAG: Crp/Fnr family transcriptional regulator [Clostridia bacterium]|nr:Crp/Fnr family transcriptional regulator [Clostridia bacterium]
MQLSEKELDTVCRSPLFVNLSLQEVEEGLAFFRAYRQRYEKGTLFHPTGTPLYAFGLVLSGTVRIFADDFHGEPMLMANPSVGEMFGESLSFLGVEDSPVYMVAAEDATVLWLYAEGLRSPLALRDGRGFLFYSRFTACLASRALSMNRRIQILSKPTLRLRLLTFFSQCEEQYGARTFHIPFDRAALASYLAVNRAALSRELSKMKEEGILDFYKNSFRLL